MSTAIKERLGEVYMELLDRKKLAKLMIIQGVSQREMAKAAGWSSHSYLGRLLAGEVKTLKVEPALRIANKLQVGVDDLFLTRVDSPAVHSGQPAGRSAA